MTHNSGDPATVLFVEAQVSGHRLFYVRLLAEAALRANQKVVLAIPSDDLATEEVQLHLHGVKDRLKIIGYDCMSLPRLERLAQKVGAQLTVVADGDWLVRPLATRVRWKGGGKLSLLVMREKAQVGISQTHRSIKTAAKFILFIKAAATKNVSLSVLKSATWQGKSRFRAAIDPVRLTAGPSDGEKLMQDWGMSKNRRWYGVLGAISARKNVPIIAEALMRVGRQDVGLLIAGEIDSSAKDDVLQAKATLEKSRVPCIIVDRLLQDEELDAAVFAVDCIVLAHSNEGPSGLLGKAAYAGTRVIAAGAYSLKEDLEQAPDLGQWTELNSDALASAIASSVASSSPIPRADDTETGFTNCLLRV